MFISYNVCNCYLDYFLNIVSTQIYFKVLFFSFMFIIGFSLYVCTVFQ